MGITKVDLLCRVKFDDTPRERSRVNMAKTKADNKPKVNVYLVSYDNGERIETPWDALSRAEQRAWNEKAMDRMMEVLGYERVQDKNTAKVLASGDYAATL